eukprot:CAMPEP_0206612898 /NCGR_PEP_ID=MMETSP0325_2-20121206/56317_1 /ASSEMBLY_ACC=CAM_ASM_000347 /TAXON_ID=2866 /ORGANISM="Crypthecodinium cohnii, Strain Seligo" /LENGTH=37 /DNA_ID= /DNA_START= /DNA_END= /DNA_ORIENTATION=
MVARFPMQGLRGSDGCGVGSAAATAAATATATAGRRL